MLDFISHRGVVRSEKRELPKVLAAGRNYRQPVR